LSAWAQLNVGGQLFVVSCLKKYLDPKNSQLSGFAQFG